MFCRSLLRLYGPTACIVAFAAGAAADVPAPPAPPAPPTPTRHAPQHTQQGQTRPSRVYLRDNVQYFPGWEDPAPHSVPPAPPSPQAQLPAVPESRCHRGCGWLGSDAFAGGATDEALPECHPLPCLIEVRWRNEPVTPEFAGAPPCALAASDGAVSCELPNRSRTRESSDDRRSTELSPIPLTHTAIPTAHECSPSPGVCFPNPDKTGHGPGCLDVEFPPAGPAAIRTIRQAPRRPPVPHHVQVASAAAAASRPLTPLLHLLRAADHLEAAGRGEAAEQLRRESAEMQRRAGQRLQELLENKRLIEQEISELQRLTGTHDQVQIRVSILEVDEQKLEKSGIGFTMPATKSSTGAPLPSADQPVIAFDLRPAAMAADQLRALRECGAAKILAEPVLVTSDGREATVFSGGGFPIAIPQGEDEVQVEWKECGVRLTATPQMLEDGRLRLDIASEVSERDLRNAEAAEGYRVPGITSRRFNAQVVMHFGETLVIGGLSQQNQTPSTVAQMLRKLPHRNRLFQQVSETVVEESSAKSLVVFVTAEPVSTAAQIPGR